MKPVIRICSAVLPALLILSIPAWAAADEPLVRVTFKTKEGQRQTVAGKIAVEAADGGILLVGRDGRLWNVTPDRLQEREPTGETFEPFTREELGRRLREELGEEFRIVRTRHYVICTNTHREYARWCGALFERLMRGFRTHWRSSGLPLEEPAFPLAAIVFANKKQYAAFAEDEVGETAADTKGYYSIRSNRMVLYDLTAELRGRPARSVAAVGRRLAASSFNVATVVHEATHQIAFNSGLHTRYADNPLWLTEGMAMYFETPDLNNSKGWRTIGQANPHRLRRFRDYVRNRRKPEALVSLIAEDDRFRDPETAGDAYAEAWALNYFLIKTRREEYVAYLQTIAAKPRFQWDDRETRLADFKAAFGEDLEALDEAFLRYIGLVIRRRGR